MRSMTLLTPRTILSTLNLQFDQMRANDKWLITAANIKMIMFMFVCGVVFYLSPNQRTFEFLARQGLSILPHALGAACFIFGVGYFVLLYPIVQRLLSVQVRMGIFIFLSSPIMLYFVTISWASITQNTTTSIVPIIYGMLYFTVVAIPMATYRMPGRILRTVLFAILAILMGICAMSLLLLKPPPQLTEIKVSPAGLAIIFVVGAAMFVALVPDKAGEGTYRRWQALIKRLPVRQELTRVDIQRLLFMIAASPIQIYSVILFFGLSNTMSSLISPVAFMALYILLCVFAYSFWRENNESTA